MDKAMGQTVSGWFLAAWGGMQTVLMVIALALIWVMFGAMGVLGVIGAVSDGQPEAAVVTVVAMLGMAAIYTVALLPFLLYYGLTLGSGVQLIRGREWAVVPASILALMGMCLVPIGTVIGLAALLLLWIPRLSPPAPSGESAPAAGPAGRPALS